MSSRSASDPRYEGESGPLGCHLDKQCTLVGDDVADWLDGSDRRKTKPRFIPLRAYVAYENRYDQRVPMLRRLAQ